MFLFRAVPLTDVQLKSEIFDRKFFRKFLVGIFKTFFKKMKTPKIGLKVDLEAIQRS
jgi:hypothetical protein